MRTLVVAPNWVGDAVMALPVLAALAASGRSLAVLARPRLHPLLALALPGIELLAKEAPPAAVVARLRHAACQEAVILPNSFRSAWLVHRAGIGWRWGYAGGLRTPLLRPAVPRPARAGDRPPWLAATVSGRFLGRVAGRVQVPLERRAARRHQTEDYRELLAAMDVAPPASWEPRLALDAAAREEGRRLLARAGIDRGIGGEPQAPGSSRPQRPGEQRAPTRERVAGLFPGAEFGPSKRWPWRHFVELARALRRTQPGLRLVIVAGPKELWTATRIFEETAGIHPVVGPDLDLARLAAVLAQLDLLITNDSGPMHLAAALGVACVALFGPTDPRRTRPAGTGHRVLWTGRWCSPCFRRRCPLVHHRCLTEIGIGEVVAACSGLLDSAPAAV